MEYYEDLIQKVKDLGNAIRECGDDAPPEMIGVQDRFIRMITGHMTDRQHNFVKWLNGEPCVFVHPLSLLHARSCILLLAYPDHSIPAVIWGV